MRSRTFRITTICLLTAVLFLLHNDEWLFVRDGRHSLFDYQQPIFGWLPAEAAYNVAWIALGAGLCHLTLRWTWRSDT